MLTEENVFFFRNSASKPATDAAYDSATSVVISQLHEDINAGRPPQLGVLFGTHNRQSVELILEQLKAKGLTKAVDGGKMRPVDGIRGRICVGQLYGAYCLLGTGLN
jgi:proline dehydrogenase